MTALPVTPSWASFPRRGWLQSPAWDAFWMFSALWGGALLLVGSLVQPLMALLLFAFALERLLSVTHAWSTTYMVLGSPLLADVRRANRRKYLVVPLAIVSVALALGLYVGAYQRYPENGRVSWDLWAWGLYLLLFWVGHFWHFGNQDFGVLTIYRERAGQTRWIDRRVDKLYTASMMFAIQPVVYVSLVGSTAFSEMVLTVLPVTRELLRIAAGAAVATAAALTLGVVAFELSKPNRSLPKLLYILVIFLHPTLLYGAVRAGHQTLALAYVIAYLWSHWFIAIGLVGRINARFHQSRGDSYGLAILRHVAVLGLLVGCVFLITEHYQEYALFNTAGFRYKQLLDQITPQTTIVIGLVLGFFLGEQLLHYYCDRCLFRFRDPEIRRRVAPLLLDDAPKRFDP